MKRVQLPPTWVVDYSAARAQAIKWLGDRYLLARPINASYEARGGAAAPLGSRPERDAT